MRNHTVLDFFRSQVSLECGSYGHDGPPLRHTSLASVPPAVIKAKTKQSKRLFIRALIHVNII